MDVSQDLTDSPRSLKVETPISFLLSMLKEYVKDSYYARFHIRSYLRCTADHFNSSEM